MKSNTTDKLENHNEGWKDIESEAFRLIIMKYGLSNWGAIYNNKLIPGQTRRNLSHKLMRMLGQQQLSTFKGRRIDVEEIWLKNQARRASGDHYIKNGIIVQRGEDDIDNLWEEEEINGLEISESDAENIQIPILPFSGTVEMKERRLEFLIKRREALLKRLTEINPPKKKRSSSTKKTRL